MEERVVVGVGGHGDGVVGGGDGGGAGAGEVEEEVGEDGEKDRKGAVEQGGEEGEGRGNEEDFGDGEEEDEKYLESRRFGLVIHYMSRVGKANQDDRMRLV